MKSVLTFFALFYSSLAFSGTGSTCLLNFETNRHPITKKLKKMVRKVNHVTLINEAKPTDILKCSEDAKEIIIVAHASPQTLAYKKADFIYYRKYEGDGKHDLLFDMFRNAEKRNDKRAMKKIVKEMKKDRPYYVPKKLLPRILQVLKKKIESGAAPVQKLRLMTCLTSAIKKRYSAISEIEDLGIQVDFAKESRFFSFFVGHPVVSFGGQLKWLRRSF